MTLSELLAAKGITNALVVDDVCDAVPTAADISPANEAWPNFNDDLTDQARQKINALYPGAAERRFDELIADDLYVAALWELRDELGDVAKPLFDIYESDQQSDQKYVDLAVGHLSALGLACATSGRNFEDAAQGADLILIDLFFSKVQDEEAFRESKERLRKAIARRAVSPPLVILMSRSPQLEGRREQFQDEVGLLDSGFRILKKIDLEQAGPVERLLRRLAENAEDSHKLARFFAALENGMNSATQQTLRLLRKLRLSDIGQVQQLLLNAEGEPVGSYLVDVFDRVLQHEVERDPGIIDAAIPLNDFSAAEHPSPYVAGSPDLQELVERLLTHNMERLRLPGAIDGLVTFGDVLKTTPATDHERMGAQFPNNLKPTSVIVVMTPVCDLQRDGAPRILVMTGELHPLSAAKWTYGDEGRTPAIRIDDALHRVEWNLKSINTLSHAQLEVLLSNQDLAVVARLRDSHALELQQRMLAGMGRVGLVAAMPATFPVNVEVYYAGVDGRPVQIDVPALSEGAVCFVGRDDKKNSVMRLIMTDHCTDNVIDALSALNIEQIAQAARNAFNHVRSSTDLRSLLLNGLSLKGVNNRQWTHIASLTGQAANAPKMGLLSWNLALSPDPLPNGDLNKAGVIIMVKDVEASVGLEAALMSGLIDVPGGGDADPGQPT